VTNGAFHDGGWLVVFGGGGVFSPGPVIFSGDEVGSPTGDFRGATGAAVPVNVIGVVDWE
jgi:hypothetical protein